MITKFYCIKKVDKITGETKYSFKREKEEAVLFFNSWNEAIEHLKSLRIDATMWLRDKKRYIGTVKTRVNELGMVEEKIEYHNKNEEVSSEAVEEPVLDIIETLPKFPNLTPDDNEDKTSEFALKTSTFNIDDVQAIKEEIIARRATREFVIEEGYVADLDEIDIHHKNLDDTCELCIGDTSVYHLTDTHMHKYNILDNDEAIDEVVEEIIEEPTYIYDEVVKDDYIEIEEPIEEPLEECQDCKLIDYQNSLIDNVIPCEGCIIAEDLPEDEEILYVEPEQEVEDVYDIADDIISGKLPEYEPIHEMEDCQRCNELWTNDEVPLDTQGLYDWEYSENYLTDSENNNWQDALGQQMTCHDLNNCLNMDDEIANLNKEISAIEVHDHNNLCEECQKDSQPIAEEHINHVEWDEHELWCKECKIIDADIALWEYNSRKQRVMDESPVLLIEEKLCDLCPTDWDIDKDPSIIDVYKDDILDEKELVVDSSKDELVVSGKVLAYNQKERIIDDGNLMLWNRVTNEYIPVEVIDLSDLNARDNLHVQMADQINIINRDCVEVVPGTNASGLDDENVVYDEIIETKRNLIETIWTRTNLVLWFVLWGFVAVLILLFIIFIILLFV
ncbi:hypothetical protein [[Mycoplasma] collis]|uniref:hypothetical protein n=1 Tax=[Mycoplasma] collis TaxID=2127 RepID=UPI00051B8515|nr:hypothetical protein [[Mycoplasma] collis]